MVLAPAGRHFSSFLSSLHGLCRKMGRLVLVYVFFSLAARRAFAPLQPQNKIILSETGFYTPPQLEGKLATDTFTPAPAPVVYEISGALGGGFLYTGAEAENSAAKFSKESVPPVCPSRTPEIASDFQDFGRDGFGWKVASDLRFRVAISEPTTPSFCGISGDLAPSTRKAPAIAIVRS